MTKDNSRYMTRGFLLEANFSGINVLYHHYPHLRRSVISGTPTVTIDLFPDKDEVAVVHYANTSLRDPDLLAMYSSFIPKDDELRKAVLNAYVEEISGKVDALMPLSQPSAVDDVISSITHTLERRRIELIHANKFHKLQDAYPIRVCNMLDEWVNKLTHHEDKAYATQGSKNLLSLLRVLYETPQLCHQRERLANAILKCEKIANTSA